VIQLGKILAFPAGEAQGLTTQLLYLEKGGTFTQNETQITVDEVPLQQTLMFLAEGANADVFPYWLTNSNRFEDSWQAVLDAQATYAVVRASQYLSARPENIAITSVPSFSEKRLSLADGWVIAFPASSPEHFELYRQLAAYLVEPRFQAEWTESAGLLPVSRTALSLWKNNEVSGILLELAESARVVPPAHIISRVGPLFAQATSEMIRQQTTYIESANKIIKSLAEVPLE
jgi:ABC-type glycerol-3-phosphate transport system substrate-binding protein